MPHAAFDRLLAPGLARYQKVHATEQWIGQELSNDEKRGFLRAHERGLLKLADDGLCVDLVGFPPPKKPKRYQLYGHWHRNAYWSWREMFIQIAFASELLLVHHWPAEAVWFEVGLDVAVIPTDSEPPVLLAEAKTNPDDLTYVLSNMQLMSTDPGAHTKAPHGPKAQNAVNKYQALADFRPHFYVEVAPDVRRAYRLSYVDFGGSMPRVAFGPATAIPSAP